MITFQNDYYHHSFSSDIAASEKGSSLDEDLNDRRIGERECAGGDQTKKERAHPSKMRSVLTQMKRRRVCPTMNIVDEGDQRIATSRESTPVASRTNSEAVVLNLF